MTDTVIELPWPPNELSGHHNAHWRVLQPIKKKFRTWAAMAALAEGASAPDGDGDILVSATFYPPDKRTDRVNMPTRLKPIWDGIADAMKVNDRRFLPTYNFALPVANPRVVIVIKGERPENAGGSMRGGAPSDAYLGGLFRTTSAVNLKRRITRKRNIARERKAIVVPKVKIKETKNHPHGAPKRDQVADLLSQDLTFDQIATRMGITKKAVLRHWDKIREALGPQAC